MAAAWVAVALAQLARPASALKVGQIAPALRVPGLSGDTVCIPNPASHAPTALIFWATWCTTCRRELPGLSSAIDSARAWGADVYTIALESDAADVLKFVSKTAPGLPVLLDPTGGIIGDAYSIRFTPTLVLLDRDGTVTRHGPLDPSRFAAEIRRLTTPRPAAPVH